ncbi:homeobox protein Mohawk-like [Saccoglossus kowalevskii]
MMMLGDSDYDDLASYNDSSGSDSEVGTGDERSANTTDAQTESGRPVRNLRNRSSRRPHMEERVRHKRQTLQDMAKPLKAWLYKHKDNPYPTKTEKILLALGSHMTLVQVSNWFANARRRLKNTVRHPGLSWAKRIRMYNHYVKGNAELLSISSGSTPGSSNDYLVDEFAEDESFKEVDTRQQSDQSSSSDRPPSPSLSSESGHSTYHDSELDDTADDGVSPHKYKHTILQRYLNDSLSHNCKSSTSSSKDRVTTSRTKKSGSLSSHDYEDMSASPNDTSSSEGERPHHTVFDDFHTEFSFPDISIQWDSKQTDETYWKEINAAMALTHMARLKQRQIQARKTPCTATC